MAYVERETLRVALADARAEVERLMRAAGEPFACKAEENTTMTRTVEAAARMQGEIDTLRAQLAATVQERQLAERECVDLREALGSCRRGHEVGRTLLAAAEGTRDYANALLREESERVDTLRAELAECRGLLRRYEQRDTEECTVGPRTIPCGCDCCVEARALLARDEKGEG